MPRKFNLLIACLLISLWPTLTFGQSLCPFDSADTETLAKCLLRPVRRGGNLGPAPATLPDPLDRLVGQPMTLDVAKLRRLLQARGVDEAALGGAFVFRQGRLVNDLTRVRFFVIHDTSSPEITASEFPANINESSWPANRLGPWVRSRVPTHVFVNRVGESATKANFSQTVGGTKYEAGRDVPAGPQRRRRARERAGQFVHIELIQPRRKSRPNTFFDLAPTPGMTPRQLDRLALLYVAASVRAGRWLLPAFHCAVDTPIPDAHDDPQNFDMDVWLGSLRSLLTELEQIAPTAARASPSMSAATDAAGEFDFPEPTAATRGRRLELWATFYHVLTAQNSENGQPLLAANGTDLGVALSERDWCGAAMEGTVLVRRGDATAGTFNFATRGSRRQVDCSRFFPRVPRGTIEAIGRTRFERARGPFGTGVQGMILVPFRTIAVDGSQRPIPFGTVIFIPEARGKEITLPSGEVVRHDGYFFAADTGGLIKGTHIDVFGGISPRNPFPNFIKSVPTGTFTAFVVNDPRIAEKLREAHRRR